jgi:hypothetical protein
VLDALHFNMKEENISKNERLEQKQENHGNNWKGQKNITDHYSLFLKHCPEEPLRYRAHPMNIGHSENLSYVLQSLDGLVDLTSMKHNGTI